LKEKKETVSVVILAISACARGLVSSIFFYSVKQKKKKRTGVSLHSDNVTTADEFVNLGEIALREPTPPEKRNNLGQYLEDEAEKKGSRD
jgi:hypothetical protein